MVIRSQLTSLHTFYKTGVWQLTKEGSSLWRTQETTESRSSTRMELSSEPLAAGVRATGSSR